MLDDSPSDPDPVALLRELVQQAGSPYIPPAPHTPTQTIMIEVDLATFRAAQDYLRTPRTLDDSPPDPITPQELDLLAATFHAAYAHDPTKPPADRPPPPFLSLLSPQANAFRRGTLALIQLLGLTLRIPPDTPAD